MHQQKQQKELKFLEEKAKQHYISESTNFFVKRDLRSTLELKVTQPFQQMNSAPLIKEARTTAEKTSGR